MEYFHRPAGATEWSGPVTGAPGAPVLVSSLSPGPYEVKCQGTNDEGPGTESDVVTVEVT
jgi:hypothetical protein